MSRRALLIVAGVVALHFIVLVGVLAIGVFAGYRSEPANTGRQPTILWQQCGGPGHPPCPASAAPRTRE